MPAGAGNPVSAVVGGVPGCPGLDAITARDLRRLVPPTPLSRRRATQSGLPGADWRVIAGMALLAVVGLHPSVRMAERFLEREGITPGRVPAPDETGLEPTPSLT
jgi:hypothetical protein